MMNSDSIGLEEIWALSIGNTSEDDEITSDYDWAPHFIRNSKNLKKGAILG